MYKSVPSTFGWVVIKGASRWLEACDGAVAASGRATAATNANEFRAVARRARSVLTINAPKMTCCGAKTVIRAYVRGRGAGGCKSGTFKVPPGTLTWVGPGPR